MWCVLFVLSLIVCSSLAGNEEHLSEQFCRQFPSLHLCRLHDTLQGSLVELQYLLQDTNAEGGTAYFKCGLCTSEHEQEMRHAFYFIANFRRQTT